MSSYIIAGSSDKVDTAECENMANLIRQYYPEISFKIVLKDLTQWEQYADEICRIYGFKQKSNPIIYTMDGCLIGDRNAFISLAESRFGFSDPKLRQGPITPDVNKKIAKQELDLKLKLQRNKKTLIEKIEQQMLIIYSNNIVQPTDGVFKQSFKSGVKEKLKTWYDSLNNLIRTDVKRNLSTDSIYSSSFRNGMKFLYKFDDRLRPIKKLQESHYFEENKETIQESKWDYDEVQVTDQCFKDYIAVQTSKSRVFVPHTAGRYQRKKFRKAQCPIVERLAGALMFHGRNTGKKVKAVAIIRHAFEIVHLLTGKNPLAVLSLAVQRGGAREDFTKVGTGGVAKQQAVDVAPIRRVNEAVHNLAKGVRESVFKKMKTIAEALADELIAASNEDGQKSYTIKKRDELEKVAKTNR
ncbi:unnamed protein product [Paramecium primaurelia]|uniref:Small ribosomal subunit protein uS7 domain-containing protein n=1 Tax=Paramecium primaurelia TaxID=5886 RepID=A0A8S1MEE2_PARPR|nr:unnamed protein product [Paramecium primaurelia]